MSKPERTHKDWHNAKYSTCSCGSHRALVDGLCSECHEENYRIEVEEYYLAQIRKNNWTRIEDGLPEIPEGKYGVPVLIATWDAVGEYQDVIDCNYIIVTNRDNKHIDPMFKHLPVGSADFAELYFGGGKSGWMPIMDRITHWQYFPPAPFLEETDKR